MIGARVLVRHSPRRRDAPVRRRMEVWEKMDKMYLCMKETLTTDCGQYDTENNYTNNKIFNNIYLDQILSN
jgi:hypothetical protein